MDVNQFDLILAVQLRLANWDSLLPMRMTCGVDVDVSAGLRRVVRREMVGRSRRWRPTSEAVMVIERIASMDGVVHLEVEAHPAAISALLSDAAIAADQLTQTRDEAGVVTLEDARFVVADSNDRDL